MDPDGRATWSPGGVEVSSTASSWRPLAVIPDGAGGALVAWLDLRKRMVYSVNVYAQRVSSAGEMLWTRHGVLLSELDHNEHTIAIGPDGAGGAVVTWSDWAESGNVAGQRIDQDGWIRWGVTGATVANGTWWLSENLVPSDQGSVLVVGASPNTSHPAILAEHLGRNGSLGMEPEAIAQPNPSDLSPAAPNPLRGGTLVRYSLAERSHVELRVFDLAGRLVRTLADDTEEDGDHTRHWDARDDAGRGVLGGVYFARLIAAGRVSTTRLVVVR
jgi:hypothetical protein